MSFEVYLFISSAPFPDSLMVITWFAVVAVTRVISAQTTVSLHTCTYSVFAPLTYDQLPRGKKTLT